MDTGTAGTSIRPRQKAWLMRISFRMKFKVAFLLFVICVIILAVSLKLRPKMPVLLDRPNVGSSPPPTAPSPTDKPNARVQPKSKAANTPRLDEDLHSPVVKDNVRNNPLKQKTKSNRPIDKKRLESIVSTEDIARFLDDLRFDSLTYFFNDALNEPQYPDPNLLNVNGIFAGPVKGAQAEQKVWDMRMAFGGIEEKVARIVVEVSEDGRNYRNLPSGYINIGDLGLVVGAPGEDFFEIFYLPQKDMFIGNYYRGSMLSMKPLGTLFLHRIAIDLTTD